MLGRLLSIDTLLDCYFLPRKCADLALWGLKTLNLKHMHLLHTPKPRVERLALSGLGVCNRCMCFKFRVLRANSAKSVQFLAPPPNKSTLRRHTIWKKILWLYVQGFNKYGPLKVFAPLWRVGAEKKAYFARSSEKMRIKITPRR